LDFFFSFNKQEYIYIYIYNTVFEDLINYSRVLYAVEDSRVKAVTWLRMGVFLEMGKGERGVFVTWLYMEASLWFIFVRYWRCLKRGALCDSSERRYANDTALNLISLDLWKK
jgi:hypothetical protein